MVQRKNLSILIFGEFCDRFNYYGIQSVLILYLINSFLFSKNYSITLYGVYSSLGFISPIIGGYFADRFACRSHLILLGILLILFGDYFLLFHTDNMLFLGLALIIGGIGLFKSNNAVLFGALYNDAPTKRDAAFTLYYASMNAGAIAGPAVYGTLALALGWKCGFLASIFGFVISLALYLWRFRFFKTTTIQQTSSFIFPKIILIGTGLCAAVYCCFQFNQYFNILIAISVLLIVIYLLYLIKPLSHPDKRKLTLLILAMCFGLFFYAVSLQVSSTLLLYINGDVNTRLFGFTIPSQYFMSLYPLLIILSAPFLAKYWTKHSQKNRQSSALVFRINLSLYLAAASFIILALSAIASSQFHAQMLLILISLLVLAIGELAIGPIVTSAVTYLAPEKQHGIFMGLWYLFIGYSAYASSLIAKLMNVTSSEHHAYFSMFMLVGGVTLCISAAMTLTAKRLARLDPA